RQRPLPRPCASRGDETTGILFRRRFPRRRARRPRGRRGRVTGDGGGDPGIRRKSTERVELAWPLAAGSGRPGRFQGDERSGHQTFPGCPACAVSRPYFPALRFDPDGRVTSVFPPFGDVRRIRSLTVL